MFLLALSAAHAFCGTYVGGADASLSNHASRIGIAREGTRTTLTLFNDFEGDSTDFAMLVPVPEGAEADVKEGDALQMPFADGEFDRVVAAEILELAIEGRRRVKEQLKKMGGLEYGDTTFSYIDFESGQETFVPVAEMGSGTIIVISSTFPRSLHPSISTAIALLISASDFISVTSSPLIFMMIEPTGTPSTRRKHTKQSAGVPYGSDSHLSSLSSTRPGVFV
jgi:hypothetical protein